jgi:hypothetical protein
MRYALLLLLAPTLLPTGCSIFVAQAGKDLSHVRTRQDAHAEFGPPAAQGVDDGKPFEEFRTRRKIAERFRAGTHSMALGMTMFLYELYLFPRELYFLAKCGLVGQTVQVTYNPDGSVCGMRIDGRWYGYDGLKRQEKRLIENPPPDVLTPTVQKLLESR